MTKILIISGSPKRDGNTARLISWFWEGAAEKGADISLVHAASLKLRVTGCTSCRQCQKKKEYACVIKDEASAVLARMAGADVIVFATPLYFFAMSAQIKVIVDRMFALYKWDNEAGTMETVLKGKTLVLMASAFEDVGLEATAEPFRLTAEYTGMQYDCLLVPNAGVSGNISKVPDIRQKAAALGRKAAGGESTCK